MKESKDRRSLAAGSIDRQVRKSGQGMKNNGREVTETMVYDEVIQE